MCSSLHGKLRRYDSRGYLVSSDDEDRSLKHPIEIPTIIPMTITSPTWYYPREATLLIGRAQSHTVICNRCVRGALPAQNCNDGSGECLLTGDSVDHSVASHWNAMELSIAAFFIAEKLGWEIYFLNQISNQRNSAVTADNHGLEQWIQFSGNTKWWIWSTCEIQFS
jgi:hypothetical protein